MSISGWRCLGSHFGKIRAFKQTHNIAFGASEEVVEADDIATVGKQTFTKERADKSGAVGNESGGAYKLPLRLLSPLKLPQYSGRQIIHN